MNLKAVFPFLVSLLLLAAVILIDRDSFNSMKDYTTQVDHTREVINQLERLSNHLKSAQVYSPSFAQLAPKQYYQLYKRESNGVHDEMANLKKLVTDDDTQRTRVNAIASLVDRHWRTLMEKNIAEIVGSGQSWRLNDMFTIHQLINRAITYERDRLMNRKEELNRSTAITSSASTVFSVLALGILIAAFASNLALSHRRKRLEAFLASILNTTRNAIINFQIIRDKDRVTDFRIAFANAAAEDLLQMKPDAIIGKCLSEVPNFSGNADLVNRFTDLAEAGEAEPFELLYHQGDRSIWLDTVLARLDDGLTATFHDITPIKAYQQELQLKIRQLHRTNENLREFTYVASHDLQEPLRKIQTFGDVLQEQFSSQLSESALDILQRMQASSRRMSTLIRDLLVYSRLSTQLAFQPVPLTKLVAEVITGFSLLVAEKHASIHVDSLPTLSGDVLQLRQLFQNLLSNALKFLRADVPAEISIRSRQVNACEVPCETSADDHQAFYELSVQDNGIGFDEQYGDRIFQLFQRLHGKTTYSGTGIGLAICKKVVENHCGYITIHSQPNEGATFNVYLPISGDN